MKATILLAIALFLATAPEPDSVAISEATARFIVLDQPAQLQAAEPSPLSNESIPAGSGRTDGQNSDQPAESGSHIAED